MRALGLREMILKYCQGFMQYIRSRGIKWQPAMIDYVLVGELGRNGMVHGGDLCQFCSQYIEVSGILSRKPKERSVFIYDRIIKTRGGVKRIPSDAKTRMDELEVRTNGISVTSVTIQLKHGGTDCPVNLRALSRDIPKNCANVLVRGVLDVQLNYLGEGQFFIKSPVITAEIAEPMEVERSLIQSFIDHPNFLDNLRSAVCKYKPADLYHNPVLAGILSIVSPCLSVLLVGEPGVGKSVISWIIYLFSQRVKRPSARMCGRGVTVAGILGPANGPDLQAGLISLGDGEGMLWVVEESDKVSKEVLDVIEELKCYGKIVFGRGRYAKVQLQIKSLSVFATANFPSTYKPSQGFDAMHSGIQFHLVFPMREHYSSAATVADSVLGIHTKEARKVTQREDECDSEVDRSDDHCTREYRMAVEIVRLAINHKVVWTEEALDRVHELTITMWRWYEANKWVFRRVGPITSEAMIRVAEALAKLHLSERVEESHIQIAYRMIISQKVPEDVNDEGV